MNDQEGTAQTLEMKALLLTFGLSLLAALRGQAFPTMEENQHVIAGRCQEMSTLLEKTDEPGKYTASRGMQVLYIIPSAVEDHCIFYYESKVLKHRIRVAKTPGDPEINQEALEDFQNAVRAGGLNPESIFIPKQSGKPAL
ncbi:Lipocalin 3 [Apodemus speciosus]|uniref:Lipocalin 3 n=1 Tax=Apodemus speciosus TaxID=105296 RepID=A0ABQ0EG52_APOSI